MSNVVFVLCFQSRSQTMNTVSTAASSVGEYMYIRVCTYIMYLYCVYVLFMHKRKKRFVRVTNSTLITP